jgi:DNA-binding NtrC family response regulator
VGGWKNSMVLGRKILIACSNPEWAHALCEVLSIWGMEVSRADSLPAARSILREQPVAVVFAEMSLRGSDFRELHEFLTSTAREVPLIALISDEKRYGEAIQCGAFDAISYPWRRSEVQWMVIHALNDAASVSREP